MRTTFSLLLAALCLLPALSPAGDAEIDRETLDSWSAPYRNWHYWPDHVIPAEPKIPGSEKFKSTDVPTVFQLAGDKKWYLSFIAFNGKGYNSFVAESTDLVHWTNLRQAMGFGPEGEFDHGGCVLGAYLYESYDLKAPRVLKKRDGKYWSLYGAYPRQGGYELRPGYEGLACSQDGLTWKRAKESYILSVHDEDCAKWEKDCIYQPWLVEHEGRFYNFYNAASGSIEQSGLAFSNDLFQWKRHSGNPIIRNTPGGWDEKFCSDPKVFRDGDHWTMIYFGVGRGGAHILAAFSRDLIHWTPHPEPLYKAGGHPDGLDKTYAHKVSLVHNPANDTLYLFYCAVGNKGRGIGLLTSKSIAGALPEEADSFTNSIGMKFVRIAPGKFRMGSVDGDFDERLIRVVEITRPFYLATTEVTNSEYEEFDPGHRKLRGKLGYSKEDNEAVVFVSHGDAMRFCEWLTQKEGKPYRLPTEAEWEYACRAGTTTAYSTGDKLPETFLQNPKASWFPGRPDIVVPLTVGRRPANPWGLHDMHGNVEEWCADWYGSYPPGAYTDPVGPATGDFRVTRGGSHSTVPWHLRSANRMGTLPEDSSWLIGFRVVQGDPPTARPYPAAKPPRNQQDVLQDRPEDPEKGPDPETPYFRGPREYVKIPPGSEGPLFSRHNHCPALVPCPNGDLLAIWYTCRREPGRELGICASRLRRGTEAWEPASPFWDAPDRNDHASALWADEQGVLYHFNGLSAAATWGSLATILRTSSDSGATWSRARLIRPEHGLRHMPIETVFRLRNGTILLPCDAAPGGSGGTAVVLSRDGGETWFDPGEGKPTPQFIEGETGHWIAGIHAPVVELDGGRLLAFGRGNNIDGQMPRSISSDGGRTWTYSKSPFPRVGGGQRPVLLRLQEGPILFVSFAKKMTLRDASGKKREVSGMFAALSMDQGETWPVRRLVTDDGPPRRVDGGGNTGPYTLGPDTAEPKGYLSICQTPDRVIHLITSKQHYEFNLAWVKAPMPAAGR